jgi:hypothetical protein
MPSATTAPVSTGAHTTASRDTTTTAHTAAPAYTAPSAARPATATDDEILGIASPRKNPPRDLRQLEFDFDAADATMPPDDRATGANNAANAATSDSAPHSNPIPTCAPPGTMPALTANRSPLPKPPARPPRSSRSHGRAVLLTPPRRPRHSRPHGRHLDPAAFASLARAMNEVATEAQSNNCIEAGRHRSREVSERGIAGTLSRSTACRARTRCLARRRPFTTRCHSACPEERRERSVRAFLFRTGAVGRRGRAVEESLLRLSR